MTKRTVLSSLVLLLFLGALSVTAAGQADKGRALAEKARLERKIRKEIFSLPYYGVFDIIGYEVKGTKVMLSGYVIRPRTKSDAEEAVGDIEGVSEVVNKIKVLPPSPSDDRIRVRIYRAIAGQGGLYRYLLGSNPSIRIIVNRGRVTLEGFVSYKSDRVLAQTAATEIFGVLSVTNNLQVEREQR